MYTSERKEAIFTQVADLHQQKISTSKTEQHLESSSNVQKEHTSQQEVQQTTEEQLNEWQKLALKEKKHVEYAQASHFSKVCLFFVSYYALRFNNITY